MNSEVKKGLNLLSSENYADAFNTLLPYAESNDMNAQAAIGLLYQSGLGVKRDSIIAIKWLEKAARQGSGDAAHNLGTLYLTCEPQRPVDKTKSKFWYNIAKDLGFEVADNQWYE